MQVIAHKIAQLTAAALALAASSFANAASVQPAIQEAIKAENVRWADAYKKGDFDAIGRLYTHDGALLQPNGERIIGPAAIVKYFKGSVGKEPNTVSFSDYEFYGDNETVTEVSDAVVRDHSGVIHSSSKMANGSFIGTCGTTTRPRSLPAINR